MSRPDDIPQDVWNAARIAAQGWEGSEAFIEKIARAILAERLQNEAKCIARAEEHKKRRHLYDDEESQTACLEAALEAFECAAAIRKGGQP